jgi:hypothetical protein
VPVSDRIFDFFNPDYDSYFYGNIHVPLYTLRGVDQLARTPPWGTPIYHSAPRLQVPRRYFEDESLSRACVDFVEAHGGAQFFGQRRWRAALQRVVTSHRRLVHARGRFESAEERDLTIWKSLRESKAVIESRLHKTVRHLCFPWYDAGDFAIRASQRAGFHANYFGNVRGRPTNRAGDDPLRISRVEGHLLERLPGAGRMRVFDIFRRLYGTASLRAS